MAEEKQGGKGQDTDMMVEKRKGGGRIDKLQGGSLEVLEVYLSI